MTDTGKITTRLRPDAGSRLRATAILCGARISHLINDALDAALPSLPQIRAMVGEMLPAAGRRRPMATAPEDRWQPLQIPNDPAPAGPGNSTGAAHGQPGRLDTGRAWLRNAMTALAVLAVAAAVVSWDAQYVMVHEVKNTPAIAALEAGIPDAGALIFAALGIALALHGRRGPGRQRPAPLGASRSNTGAVSRIHANWPTRGQAGRDAVRSRHPRLAGRLTRPRPRELRSSTHRSL